MWQVGRPRRVSELSIAGRSSWMREYVWMSSTAQATGNTARGFPPQASALVTVPTVAMVSVSLNSKPLHIRRSFPLHADIFDPGTCRPAPHAGHELFQRPDVAFSDDLDATVGYVARPSGHPPPLSLLQGEEPKPHPLHAPADPEVAAGPRLRDARLASVIHWRFPIVP